MPASTVPPLRLDGFDRFGGVHWVPAALAHALAWEDVALPHSRRPLSEAMCFGLAGGIAAGFASAPSRPAGGGVSVVGRYREGANGPDEVEGALRRLGARTKVRETAGARAADRNLESALAAGHPAFVWCAPPPMLAEPWTGTCGSYVLLVHGLDRARRRALIADRARRTLELPLAELARLRAKVRAHRRRVLTFTPPARLGTMTLRRAITESVRLGVRDMLRPRVRTLNLPGLAEWARQIANPANRRGWPVAFPGGRLFGPLRDVYHSIETAGTGGGLLRPLYAAFLREAAVVTGRRRLRTLARTYDGLGADWTALARTALPERVPAFRRARRLLAERARLIRGGGPALATRMEENRVAMRAIEARMRRSFPLDHAATMELLTRMSECIADLHAAEARTARELWAAVQ